MDVAIRLLMYTDLWDGCGWLVGLLVCWFVGWLVC